MTIKRIIQGFTIIELVVVISIIGILAAISIVSYSSWKQKTTIAQLKSDLNGAVSALENSRTFNNTYPSTVPSTFVPSSGVTISGGGLDSGKGFCVTATNGSVSYRVTDGIPSGVGNCSRTSCLDILNSGESGGDGTYGIKPSATTFRVYCDMANGGWTRLNNSISTSTTPFDNSEMLVTNNVPGACGSPGCAFTINNILITHTNIKVLLTRTTSIAQCPGLTGASVSSVTYWNGSGWTSSGTCLWNDGIFANGSSTNMTGLKMLWKLEGTKATNGEIRFTSQCSDSTDSGQIKVTAWVK